jgi:hypothetical protein
MRLYTSEPNRQPAERLYGGATAAFGRFPNPANQGGSALWESDCLVSLRLQERVLIGVIGFIVFVVLAYLFGMLECSPRGGSQPSEARRYGPYMTCR